MHKIKKEVLIATLDYLATQPYAQVAKLIDVLSKCEEIKEIDASKIAETK